jgi:WXG100 family type VII secretion target
MADVRMNYGSMEQMAKAFRQMQGQIDESTKAMQKVAQMMEGGALQGDGGDAFRGAIQEKLLPRMKRLESKMAELVQDMQGAVSATRDGVSTAQSRFK